MKVLNLYAGIGGNRKLWEDVDVTAVEINPEIANIYNDFYPNDKVFVTDAHKYLLEHYKEFDIGPGTEICVGWSYIPLNYLTDKQGFWMYNEDAILLKMEHRNIHNSEVPLENEIWLIPYGKPKAVLDLIQYAVQKELETNESIVFEVFCKSEVADLLKKIGFNPYEDERLCVILFEKILN